MAQNTLHLFMVLMIFVVEHIRISVMVSVVLFQQGSQPSVSPGLTPPLTKYLYPFKTKMPLANQDGG